MLKNINIIIDCFFISLIGEEVQPEEEEDEEEEVEEIQQQNIQNMNENDLLYRYDNLSKKCNKLLKENLKLQSEYDRLLQENQKLKKNSMRKCVKSILILILSKNTI